MKNVVKKGFTVAFSFCCIFGISVVDGMAGWVDCGSYGQCATGGNIGIGTNDPQYLLNLKQEGGQHSSDRMFVIDMGSTIDRQLVIGSESGNPSVQSWKRSLTGYRPLLLNPRGGNVGIGTTSPLDSLHIAVTEPQKGFSLTSDGTLAAKLWTSGSNSGKGRLSLYHSQTLVHLLNADMNGVSFLAAGGGKVGIGTDNPQEKLDVEGNIMATGFINAKEINVKVDPRQHPDFVFEKDYNLMSLDELEKSVAKNKHLPGIPSAKEAGEKGLNVGEMQTKLLQKIEKLTLYVIEQNKKIEAQQAELKVVKEKIK